MVLLYRHWGQVSKLENRDEFNAMPPSRNGKRRGFYALLWRKIKINAMPATAVDQVNNAMKRNGYEIHLVERGRRRPRWWTRRNCPVAWRTVPLDGPPSRTPKMPSGSGSRPQRMTARKSPSHAAACSLHKSWLARGQPDYGLLAGRRTPEPGAIT